MISNPKNPRALLIAVMEKSISLCKKVYKKVVIKDDNYRMMIKKNCKEMSVEQIRVAKLLLKWRDYVARLNDESPHYMLPKDILFEIAKGLPNTPKAMSDCCYA
jgi:exosome complex exonuclease RRP6